MPYRELLELSESLDERCTDCRKPGVGVLYAADASPIEEKPVLLDLQ